MTIATVARDRYFDLDAVRTPAREDKIPPPEGWTDSGARPSSLVTGRERFDKRLDTHGGMAPPLDWWEIATQPYKGAHYATWPEKLCDRPILSMVPERVCETCGEPSRRIVESKYVTSRMTRRG
jgi:site-specific DNA-methyltransferase (adenine-specific)